MEDPAYMEQEVVEGPGGRDGQDRGQDRRVQEVGLVCSERQVIRGQFVIWTSVSQALVGMLGPPAHGLRDAIRPYPEKPTCPIKHKAHVYVLIGHRHPKIK